MTAHEETANQAAEAKAPLPTVKELFEKGTAAIGLEAARLIEEIVNGNADSHADDLFRLLAMIVAVPRIDRVHAGVVEDYALQALFVHTSHGRKPYRALIDEITGQSPRPDETAAPVSFESEGRRAHIMQIGEQIAAFIDHPQTPELIVDKLTDFWFEIHNETTPQVTPENASRQMRRLWPDLADEMMREVADE